MVEHSTPQVKVTPLIDVKDKFKDTNVPGSTPLQPYRMNEEEKQRAKSMATL